MKLSRWEYKGRESLHLLVVTEISAPLFTGMASRGTCSCASVRTSDYLPTVVDSGVGTADSSTVDVKAIRELGSQFSVCVCKLKWCTFEVNLLDEDS